MCCCNRDSFREKWRNKKNSFCFVSHFGFIPNGYKYCSICNRIHEYTGRERERERASTWVNGEQPIVVSQSLSIGVRSQILFNFGRKMNEVNQPQIQHQFRATYTCNKTKHGTEPVEPRIYYKSESKCDTVALLFCIFLKHICVFGYLLIVLLQIFHKWLSMSLLCHIFMLFMILGRKLLKLSSICTCQFLLIIYGLMICDGIVWFKFFTFSTAIAIQFQNEKFPFFFGPNVLCHWQRQQKRKSIFQPLK